MTEFIPYGKTPRLFRDAVITEKIDGTNAGVRVQDGAVVAIQSRNRLITPDQDNAGFARWVDDNRTTLALDLGDGLHFGEWWGQGIQRGYGLTEKRFSLFNAGRFEKTAESFLTARLHVVPVLGRYTFDTGMVDRALAELAETGSQAAPGFMRPEGVIVYHSASRQVFKALLENDSQPKGLAA